MNLEHFFNVSILGYHKQCHFLCLQCRFFRGALFQWKNPSVEHFFKERGALFKFIPIYGI